MRPASSLAASAAASVFSAAVRLRNALYDRGTLSAAALQGPVISVGNLSVGGAGKTPFVILLGELLRNRGVAFDVLTRGYGRDSASVEMVDPNGCPGRFGDEPLLIARRLSAPVFVGEQRHAAGVLAEQRLGPQLHLLDDGFQHRELARDFDIVLLTPEDIRDHLLPRGRLREPLASLRRADAVALMSGAPTEALPAALREAKRIFRVRRGILPRDVPPHPVAFCGIARPQSFFLQLRKAGIEPAAEAAFRDHYRYSPADIRALLSLKRQSEADGFVTTEKDAVNLGPLREELQPLSVVPVRMQLEDAAAALDAILQTVAARKPQWTAPSSQL
ncbi:MAG: tetraacyldisaccharide 4'-kinase [Acidobacteria bacterium]|nr:tetraacyldisaccharide 4'-kinase [Acidobacteriota bacterium]